MPEQPDRLTIRRPDDWHLHLRDGPILDAVVGYTARHFARAIIMPNLNPPITTPAQADAYRGRILAAAGASDFQPLMTGYLTEQMKPAEVVQGFRDGHWVAMKYYPAGATTGSHFGVTDVAKVMPVLEAMAEAGMPLLVHGEVTDPDVDVFDREAVFIERVLEPLIRRLPSLKLVMEHVTSRDGIDFVEWAPDNVAATITVHHMIINRNAMFAGGIRPHMYCLPIPKREPHRRAVRRAAVSGKRKFFMGTDSAPHVARLKETGCGCAGIFTAPVALALCVQIFEEDDRLYQLERFLCENGALFYGLPLNRDTITLERKSQPVDSEIVCGNDRLVPFQAGGAVAWRVAA
jgi:dihydroorotase